MKAILKIVVTCFGLIAVSASSCDEQIEKPSRMETAQIERDTHATVTTKFVDDGCEVLLEIIENGKNVMLMPINIEDQYKVDGLKVIIQFHSSRIMQATCQIGRPIVIEKIYLVD